MEYVVKSVAHKRLGSAGPVGTNSEALHGWILKLGDDSKELCISVEYFVEWLANTIPSWAAYCSSMSGHLIVLDKQLGVLLVGVRETWCRNFANCVMKVTEPEANHAFTDDQICAGLKSGIYWAVHGFQYIWDANYTKKKWAFLLIDAENAFIEMNQIRMLCMVCNLWPSGAHLF